MMIKRFQTKAVFVFIFLFVVNFYSFGNISIPEIFSDNMVLQQNAEVTFWGWAKSGETVKISADWMNAEKSVKTGNQGTWEIKLKTPSAGGPFNISIKGYNEINLKNVLVGEVWLCSGQSNMEWSANSGIINAEEEIKNADYPEIRLFQVLNSTSHYPQDHLTGEWTETTPETMRSFSAIGYFFARRLHEKLGVPVGIINSSWGGTPAEAWMPEKVIQGDDFLKEAAKKQKPVPWGPVEPGRLYNAMIAPLIPYQIAGALWYQGEANTVNASAYEELLTALIGSWREKWNYQFPFYFAQIAPYNYGDSYDGVIVRDEQRRALDVPKTGMVVLSDIGDTLDIHPKNKHDVGLRFANLALNRHYQTEKILDSGPLFKEMKIENDQAVVSFNYAKGLHVEGKNLTGFEIAGEDGVYHPAKAKIKNGKVIVQSKEVEKPVNVRFAWRNTATPNLCNEAGLPASSFTTE